MSPARSAVPRAGVGRTGLGAPFWSRKLKPLIPSAGMLAIVDCPVFVAATWLLLAIPGAGNLAMLVSTAQGLAVRT